MSTALGDATASAAGRCGHSRTAPGELPRGDGQFELRHPMGPIRDARRTGDKRMTTHDDLSALRDNLFPTQ